METIFFIQFTPKLQVVQSVHARKKLYMRFFQWNFYNAYALVELTCSVDEKG